jgi:hypothetical protein
VRKIAAMQTTLNNLRGGARLTSCVEPMGTKR